MAFTHYLWEKNQDSTRVFVLRRDFPPTEKACLKNLWEKLQAAAGYFVLRQEKFPTEMAFA